MMTTEASHQGVADVMRWVLLALIPAIIVYLYLYGWGGVITLALCLTAGMLFEILALKLRRSPIVSTVKDNSTLVTTVLLALCLPPLMPWWVYFIAVAVAVLLAKHTYGGLGKNIFNPAMTGYAFVLVCFPLDVSTWITAPNDFQLSFSESIYFAFGSGLSQSDSYDTLTGATALSRHYELSIQSVASDAIEADVGGIIGARVSEWLNIAFLTGGLLLMMRKIITWHLPVSMLMGILIVDLFIGGDYPDLFFFWFGGATMMGAFFIITDPVTAPASNRARLTFGIFTGILIYLIRHYGDYPDSVAFAVLLMNCCVPLIDRIDTILPRR